MSENTGVVKLLFCQLSQHIRPLQQSAAKLAVFLVSEEDNLHMPRRW